MYKVFPVVGGWQVFYIEENLPPRQQDGHPHPYKHRQSAYKRCKKLNTILDETQKMIDRDSAIII